MDACPLSGVILIDAFQSIFQRPVADVLVVGGVDLLLGYQKCPVFLGQKRRRNREIQDIACLESPIFSPLASVPNRSAPSVIRAMQIIPESFQCSVFSFQMSKGN